MIDKQGAYLWWEPGLTIKKSKTFFVFVFIYLSFIIVQPIVFATSLFYANQGLILCSHVGPNSAKAHDLPFIVAG